MKGLVVVQNTTASRVVYMVYGYTSCTSYILDDEEFETTALYPSSSQVGPRTQMG
jgi:hypothetical protein